MRELDKRGFPEGAEVVLPSGQTIHIREQTGEDEEIVSNFKDMESLSSFNKYLARIIEKPLVTEVDIEEWLLADKYYALLRSRIYSLGSDLKVNYKCPECGHEANYVFDLHEFNADYSNYDEVHGPRSVKPYPNGGEKMHTFKVGENQYRFKLADGETEQKAMKLRKDQVNSLALIRHRKLEWFNDSDQNWYVVQNFKKYTSKEVAAIRANIQEKERNLVIADAIICENCGHRQEIILLFQPDFFSPTAL